VARRFSFDASIIEPASITQAGLTANRGKNLSLDSGKFSRALQLPMPSIAESIEDFYRDYASGLPGLLKSYALDKNKISAQKGEGNLGKQGRTMTRHSLSVLIPIHNEREIVKNEVRHILDDLGSLGLDYELLLVENGSTDGTLEILQQMAQEDPHIVLESLPRANYGQALKRGILKSTKDIIVVFNLELRDMKFLRLSLDYHSSYDLIIASKMMPGGRDERSFLRRMTSRGFNLLLKWLCGFTGTDTHGMKSFWREPMAAIARRVVTDGFILETELVIRAERMGFRIKEVPVHVKELRRRPTMSLLGRVPGTLTNLWRLFWTLNQEQR
jgi:hypothetical protein